MPLFFQYSDGTNTIRWPIVGPFVPDSSGKVFPDLLSNQLALTNSKDFEVMVMQDPAGGGDVFFECGFPIPRGYSSTPVLVIQYILDGSPANLTVAFFAQQVAVAHSETVDIAYEAEDIASVAYGASPTEVDEDWVEETITLTPASAYVEDDWVFLKFGLDDSVGDYTGNVLV